jgi:hypothetical protein
MKRLTSFSACLIIVLSTGIFSPPAIAFNLSKEIGHCFHGGCDVAWTLNQRFDEGIRSKSESIVGPAKEAFLQAMDMLFDKKLNPMIDKINTDFSDRLDQAGTILQNTEKGIDEIIDRAAEKAILLEHESIDDIKSQIIDASFKQANDLVDKVDNDIEKLIADIDCKFAGQEAAIQEYIKATFSFIPHPLDECYRDNGFVFSLPDSRDYINIYFILKCQYNRDLRNSSNVGLIKKNYSRLVSIARRFQCIEQSNHAFYEVTSQDIKTASEKFEMWLLASQ